MVLQLAFAWILFLRESAAGMWINTVILYLQAHEPDNYIRAFRSESDGKTSVLVFWCKDGHVQLHPAFAMLEIDRRSGTSRIFTNNDHFSQDEEEQVTTTGGTL